MSRRCRSHGEGTGSGNLESGLHEVSSRLSRANCTPLPTPSIDTGMGLERACGGRAGKDDELDSGSLRPIIPGHRRRAVEPMGLSKTTEPCCHCDHLRAVTFLIADGDLAVE